MPIGWDPGDGGGVVDPPRAEPHPDLPDDAWERCAGGLPGDLGDLADERR